MKPILYHILLFTMLSIGSYSCAEEPEISKDTTSTCATTVPCGRKTPGCTTVCKCVSIPARGSIPPADIFVRISGKHKKGQPTLVFVHGFNANAEAWQCQESGLCSCFQTVSFDLRGNFRSTLTPPANCPGGINYTMDVFSDDIYAVLQCLNITKNIIMIGHSMGSGITLNYAARHPEGLCKIVLVSGSPQYVIPDCAVNPPCGPGCICGVNPFEISTCCNQCSSCYPFGITSGSTIGKLQSCITPSCYDASVACPPTTCLGLQCECVAQCVAPLLLNAFTDRCTDPGSQQAIQEFINLQLPLLVELYGNSFTANIQFSIINNAASENQTGLLSSIKIPTLICFGSVDTLVDPRNSIYMHQNIKGSKLAEFFNKGHSLTITDYKQFNKLLKKFIKNSNLPKEQKIYGNCSFCPVGFNFTQTSCTPVAE